MYYLASKKLHGCPGHEAGRALLAALYAETVGTPLPPIEIAPGGKPYFADSPWHFSISHTQNHVFCVLSDRPIGIDAEELSRRVTKKLAQKILSPAEFAQYARAEDKNKALLTFWVLKEAQAKLTGRGIQYPPNQTEFSLSDSRLRELDGCLVAIITEDDHAL